jgi:hypothetical protein
VASNWRQRSVILAVALWWGSLSALLAWVVPLLFVHLPSPALAGNTAAHLFSAQTWVALGCGLLVLMGLRWQATSADQAQLDLAPLGWAAGGMLVALLLEFGVSPHIVARDNLRLWHSLGTLLYGVQWLCTGVLLWRLAGEPSRRA